MKITAFRFEKQLSQVKWHLIEPMAGFGWNATQPEMAWSVNISPNRSIDCEITNGTNWDVSKWIVNIAINLIFSSLRWCTSKRREHFLGEWNRNLSCDFISENVETKTEIRIVTCFLLHSADATNGKIWHVSRNYGWWSFLFTDLVDRASHSQLIIQSIATIYLVCICLLNTKKKYRETCKSFVSRVSLEFESIRRIWDVFLRIIISWSQFPSE